MQHIYGLTEDEINAAPDNDLMEVALDTMRFTHEKRLKSKKLIDAWTFGLTPTNQSIALIVSRCNARLNSILTARV